MQLGKYRLNHPESLDTPAMLTYPHLVQRNIEEVIKICGGADRIVPHAKTHKSPDVLRMQVDMGLTSFKCATLKEAEIAAENGATEIVMAYPMIHPRKLDRLAKLMATYSEVDVRAIASTQQHLSSLSSTMREARQSVGVYMDLDTGMRRTGVQPGDAAYGFYDSIASADFLDPLGVHVFDGETLYIPDFHEREIMVKGNLSHLENIWEQADKRGIPVTDNLAGGSWSFIHYVEDLRIRVTPGTWAYWDTRNSEMEELEFEIASLVLGQVIDRDDEMGTVTLDIGSKACSSDQPLEHRFRLIDFPYTELVQQSEEHGVVKLNGESLDVGQFVLAAPGHACTLTVKFPYTNVIDENGDRVGSFEHAARDR